MHVSVVAVVVLVFSEDVLVCFSVDNVVSVCFAVCKVVLVVGEVLVAEISV